MSILSNLDDVLEKELKFVILGEASSGKTSLVARYCNDEFSRQYYPTIGVDVFLKRTSIEGKNVRIIIWDVSGNALNSTLLDKYLYKADVVLLTFDITNATSFIVVPSWYNAIVRHHSGNTLPFLTVFANKCDIEHQRAITVDKQNKYANDHNLTIHSVSARTGENVSLAFQKVVAHCFGIKLTQIEQEMQNKVIRAEIFTSHPHHVLTSNQGKSSMCKIQ